MQRFSPRLLHAFLGCALLATLVAPGVRADDAKSDTADGKPPALSTTIRWSTASEVENFGFDVYRGETKDGPFVRLTETPILGAGTVDTPSQYAFVDDTIEPDKEYFYYVESISMDGEREPFTPVARVAPKPAPKGDGGRDGGGVKKEKTEKSSGETQRSQAE